MRNEYLDSFALFATRIDQLLQALNQVNLEIFFIKMPFICCVYLDLYGSKKWTNINFF